MDKLEFAVRNDEPLPGTQPKPIEVDDAKYMPGVYEVLTQTDWAEFYQDLGGEG